MTTQVIESPALKPTREQALRTAARRKAARRARTARIRRGAIALAVAAFIGPLGVISAQMTAGKDPAVPATHTGAVAAAEPKAAPTAPAPAATTATPAPVTTQQS